MEKSQYIVKNAAIAAALELEFAGTPEVILTEVRVLFAGVAATLASALNDGVTEYNALYDVLERSFAEERDIYDDYGHDWNDVTHKTLKYACRSALKSSSFYGLSIGEALKMCENDPLLSAAIVRNSFLRACHAYQKSLLKFTLLGLELEQFEQVS